MSSAAENILHGHGELAVARGTVPVRYAVPRALAELDPDRHHVVEASAGTGKTYLIEHRVVDLLLTTDTLLEHILVVTFTERATAELRFRIRRLIETVSSVREHTAAPDEPHWSIDEAARRKLRDALLAFDRAAIYTIHAFCQRVLTENAFANRRLFAQSQIATEEAFAQAFKAALREHFARNEPDRSYLAAWLRSGRTVEALESLLYRCANQRGRLVPEHDPAAIAHVLERAHAELPALDDDALRRALGNARVHASTRPALIRRLHALRQLLDGFAGHHDVPAFLAEVEAMDRELGTRPRRLLPYLAEKLDAAELPRGQVVAFDPAARALVTMRDLACELERTVVPLAAAVAQTFLPAVNQRMDEDKSRRGQFDFHDMLRLVWDSIRGSGDSDDDGSAAIVARLRERYRHALIDEFQDTDELQWRIFRRLYIENDENGANGANGATSDASVATTTTTTTGEPGAGGAHAGNRLCIIGDPKQAIYSFRGADVYTYLEARKEVGQAGGQITNLIDNYRSTDLLVRAYNTLFEERFGTRFFTGDIRYDHPVRAATDIEARGADGLPIVPICLLHVTPPEDGKLRAESVRHALLRRITSEIRRLLHDPDAKIHVGIRSEPENQPAVVAGDIFVLTRTISESNEIAASLRQAGIPCAIYKQEGLFQTREAREVCDLLAGVAEPHQRSARFRAWATRFFGVTLSDLPHLVDVPDTHPLVARLFEWRALADNLAYEELFARIIDDSGIIERELFLDTSERSLTNFLHLFELLLEEVMRSRCELHELIQRLIRWMADTAELTADERNVQRLESEKSAVQIMTIHRSKGLEARVVFIYGGLGGFPGDEVKVYHQGGERLVHVGYSGGTVEDAVDGEAASEDQRLLYVALTRAAARLYLPYVDPDDYKVRGSYAELVPRLVTTVRALEAGDSDLARLFTITPVASRSEDSDPRDRRAAIASWEPPGMLLAAAPGDDALCDEIRQQRGGFVITSYTRMKSHGGTRVPLSAVDFKADIAETSARLPDHQLPGGAQSGVFLHNVLEHIDFASVVGVSFDDWRVQPEVARLFRHALLRHNRDPQHLLYSQKVIYHCLTSPIALSQKTVLESLASCRRIMREVEFVYPIPTSADQRRALGLHALDGQPGSDAIRLERGYVKGFIDLVFELRGRVYAIDWKSDILPDYTSKTMARHVFHEYQVQAELYALALARMLEVKTEYQHKRRFGGLLYLFMRGMGSGPDPEGRQSGVYYIRPSFARLAELEAALEERDDYR